MTLTKRGVIYPTMQCDAKCVFCYYKDLGIKFQRPLDEVKEKLDKFKNVYNMEYVDITGGEPTIYPHLKEMVSYCSQIGLKPTIITNAQSPKVFPDLIERGLNDVLISIHGTDKTYDKIVGMKDSFKNVKKTIDVLNTMKTQFRSNTTMIKYNVETLPEIAEFLRDNNVKIANFISFNPHEGTSWATKSPKFQISYSEAVPYLKQAIDILTKKNIWVNVRYFPLCLLQGYVKHICNIQQWQHDPYEWRYEISPEEVENIYKNRISAARFYGKTPEEKIFNYTSHKYSCGYNLDEIFKEILSYPFARILGKRNKRGNIIQEVYYYYDYIKRAIYGKMNGNIWKDECRNCVNFLICDGIYPQYAKKFGMDEFHPIDVGFYILDPIYYRRHIL